MGKNIFDRYLTSVVHSSMPIRVKAYNKYLYWASIDKEISVRYREQNQRR